MAGEHLQRAVHVRAIDGGNGAHGQTMLRRKWSKQALSEQQGGIRELTAQTVEEERARAKLSTGACRRRGRSSVEGSVWWRRDSGKRQNGTGEVCRSSWRFGRSGVLRRRGFGPGARGRRGEAFCLGQFDRRRLGLSSPRRGYGGSVVERGEGYLGPNRSNGCV